MLEITQKATNAEVYLCSAKISDKKPIRLFLPYVLERIFFFKQICVQCSELDQLKSSEETDHLGEVSEFSWVICTPNHMLDVPPKGVPCLCLLVKPHTEIMGCQVCGLNRAVPKITSCMEAKNRKLMMVKQRTLLATAPFEFLKYFKRWILLLQPDQSPSGLPQG